MKHFNILPLQDYKEVIKKSLFWSKAKQTVANPDTFPQNQEFTT